jgi:hypothetical protein
MEGVNLMERRKFLAGVSVVVAGTTQLPAFLSSASHQPARPSTRRHDFEQSVGTQFRVYDTDGRFVDKVRLLAIEDGPCCSGLEQFSLVFGETRGPVLSEGIWTLKNGSATEVLALTPVGVGSEPRYRAVFNLVVQS